MALSRSSSGSKVNETSDSFRSRSPSIRYQPLQLDIESDVEVRRKMFRQKQLKKLCWAGTLALFGFIMIIVGLNWYSINRKGYSAFLLVGCIMFIPGAYGVYEVISTYCQLVLIKNKLYYVLFYFHLSLHKYFRLLAPLMVGVDSIN